MKICKNCKHWKLTGHRGTYGDCGLITLENKAETGEDLTPEPGRKAYAQDASDYAARVCCEEDFGCLLWDAKK
jgi:hypothetical protein